MAYEPKAAVHVPLMDFQELEFHLLATRPGVKPDVFVGELLHRWLLIEKERRAVRENGVMHGRFIWLRFPGEEHWVRAADYRQHFNHASNAVWSMRRPARPNTA